MVSDPSISSSSTAASAAYWEPPADAQPQQGDLNQNAIPAATDSQGTDLVERFLPALDPAIPVSGSSSNPSERTQRTTPDGKRIQVDTLHTGDQATIARERTQVSGGGVSNDQLVFTTNGSADDNVQVSQRSDGTVVVNVNGEEYDVALAQRQELTLRVGAGDDVITVAPNVRVNVVVEGGDGNDAITVAGSGDNRIDGGAGDDTIDLSASSGRNDAFGNTGNDTITGGSGADVVYGGDGNDILSGGAGENFIEGGAGNDRLDGSRGKNVLSAGVGDDTVVSGGQNRIILGQGEDRVEGATATDRIFAESVDAVSFAAGQRDTGQVVVNVAIDPRLGSSVTVQGSDSFRQRVEAELDLIRALPGNSGILAEFDRAAQQGNTVTIRELANEQNGYAQTLGRGNAEITNGRAGAGGDVIVSYNPSFHMDAFPAPSIVLFHELSHAYNGVTGTFQPGTYRGTGPDSGQVPNAERQAVGLETSAAPFDFDRNPSTPATTANPDAFTENGFRDPLGYPDRPSYAL